MAFTCFRLVALRPYLSISLPFSISLYIHYNEKLNIYNSIYIKQYSCPINIINSPYKYRTYDLDIFFMLRIYVSKNHWYYKKKRLAPTNRFKLLLNMRILFLHSCVNENRISQELCSSRLIFVIMCCKSFIIHIHLCKTCMGFF
jgi:hypothetical protein